MDAEGPGLSGKEHVGLTLDFPERHPDDGLWCGLQARALHSSAQFLGVPFAHPTFDLAIC